MKFQIKRDVIAPLSCFILLATVHSGRLEAKQKDGVELSKSGSKQERTAKGDVMDKCTVPSEASKTGTPVFNALDLMKEGCAKSGVRKAQGGAMSDDAQNANLNAVGEAWLDENGSIVLRMRRTSDGIDVDSTKHYKAGDKYYDEVWKHLGGLKPGEKKLVQPWPD